MDGAPYTDDLDLGAVNTRGDLAAVLRLVHIRADRPSLRRLEAMTRHTASPLSKTVVAEMLRGVRFPRKATMVAFLMACGVKDNSIEMWLRAWERVAAAGEGPALPAELQVFKNVAAALRGSLTRDADGRPLGWPRDLRDLRGNATAASTAYGIKTMLLLEDGLAADLVPVAENLQRMAGPDGGFASRGHSWPRPEATALILSALRRVATTGDFGAAATQMENGLGDFEKSRPFILTTILETGLLLESGGGLVETLVESLLAARRPYGDRLLWPETAQPLLIDPAPSVVHTARAVRVLADLQAIRQSNQVQEAVEQAVTWLIERRDLDNEYEFIERPVNKGLESVHVRHFTAAWVVKALVSAGMPTAHPAVGRALTQIWDSYGGDSAALWAWNNGDLPIWMTFDAVEALRLAQRSADFRHSAKAGDDGVVRTATGGKSDVQVGGVNTQVIYAYNRTWTDRVAPLPSYSSDSSATSRHYRIFLCHSSGDKRRVRKLCRRLREQGFDPWLDEENIVAGQDWDAEIRKAVRAADLVIVCMSKASVGKTGYVQREIRMVLDLADEQPEGKIFIIPAKLEDCEVPDRPRPWHWVDLYRPGGYDRLFAALARASSTSSS